MNGPRKTSMSNGIGDMRIFVMLGAINGALAVAFGAFAAHGMSGSLAAERVDWMETAARYQLVHALGLMVAGWMTTVWPGWPVRIGGWAFLAGAVLFSGGLYVAALTGWKAVIAVVPIGGAGYIVGWLALAAAAIRASGRPR